MYKVRIAEPAEQDMQEQRDWWAENRSPSQAARWHALFTKRLRALRTNANSYPRADEGVIRSYDLRQLNFGVGGKATHRALFVVRDDEVIVLRVRHLAQAPITEDDL